MKIINCYNSLTASQVHNVVRRNVTPVCFAVGRATEELQMFTGKHCGMSGGLSPNLPCVLPDRFSAIE